MDVCPICLEHCLEPTSLACAHVYCVDCIRQHLRHAGTEASCPLCRMPIDVPKVLPGHTSGQDTGPIAIETPAQWFSDGTDDATTLMLRVGNLHDLLREDALPATPNPN
eukprot:2585609-Prymnesium_polylepis.1